MANTPFKLKSGNTTPFKQMGSSPLDHPHSEPKRHGTHGHNTDTGKSVAEGGKANPGNPNYVPPKKDSPAKQIVGFHIFNNARRKLGIGKKNSLSDYKYVKPTTKDPKKGLSQYDPKRGDDPYTPTTSYKSKHDTEVPMYKDPKRYKRPSIKLGISKEQFMKSKI